MKFTILALNIGSTSLKTAVFEDEKELLLSHWGKPPYIIQDRVIRHVAKDCLVSFQTNRYTVPHRFVGKQVEVQSDNDFIRIYHQGELIALHPRLEGKYQVRSERAHYQGIFNHRQPESRFYLAQNGQEEVLVFVGGIIPKKDIPDLLNAGVTAVYGPGTNTHQIGEDIIKATQQLSK